MAACLLGAAGITTLVVDKQADIYDRPRAVALDHEIARVLQNIGLGEALTRFSEPFSASEYYGVDGQLIKRLDMLPPPYPLSWTPSMVFLQPALEEALRAHLKHYACVQVSLGPELVGIQQGADSVVAMLRQPEGGETRVEARYVLACDGASSTTRRLVDMSFEDLDFDQPWLVVDVRANERGVAKLPKVSMQRCDPRRPTTYIVATGNHRRWEIMLLRGEDRFEMERPERVWELLSDWMGPQDGTLWRAASYRFHALVAKPWRRGRVLVAGDAAHQQPPFLGQGLCQGVRDAANVTWKLARVLRGESSPGLLDTYETERAEHVRNLTITIKSIGKLVSERDVNLARERDARLLVEAGGTVRSQPRQDLMPTLTAGCLGSGALRGTMFPQPMVQTAQGPRRLDDVVGGGWRLVLAGADVPAGLRERLTRLGVRSLIVSRDIVEQDAVLTAWFSRAGALAAMVRPDHYVFGTIADATKLPVFVEELEAALA